MNRCQAKELSESGITVGQIKDMLMRAYDAGDADSRPCDINPGISRGASFNIFWRCYSKESDDKVISGLGDRMRAQNAIRIFGDYWPGETPTIQQPTEYDGPVHHEDPINVHAEFQSNQ